MKIGVVGTGSVGRRHARNLVSLGHDAVLCSEWQSGGGYLEELRELPLVTSYERLLEESLDGVIIANSTHLHARYAARALEIGFPVYLEKPAGVSSGEVAGLLDVRAKKGPVVAVGYQHRFNPLLAALRDIYRSGELGQIVSVSCSMGEYLPGYHPEEDYRTGYAAREDMGGGVLRTQIHDINCLHWICGPLDVLCAQGGKVSQLEIDVEDSVSALLQTGDAVPVSLHMDYLQKVPRRTLEILGVEGGTRWSYQDNTLVIWLTGREPSVQGGRDGFDRNQSFLDCLADFVSCIASRGEPRSTLQHAYDDLRVVESLRSRLTSVPG